MITHDSSVNSPTTSLQEQQTLLRQLRSELLRHYRPLLLSGPGPIRVMARIVAELEQECRKRNIAPEVQRTEIVNRTIGDVNLRLVTECEGEPGGPSDYRLLADELGIALPGEQLHDYTATGEAYLWLRNQMMECERLLLSNHFDPRIYDIYGVGNPVLRSWLVQEMQKWSIQVSVNQLYLSLGAMDGIDKVLRGMAFHLRQQSDESIGILFPQPGFNVPEWQARSYGYHLHGYPTSPEQRFKLTPHQLEQILQSWPDIRLIYLTVTNNPTTFAYTADELNALHAVLRRYWEQGRTLYILADLAYIGTGKPEEDLARMATFTAPDVLQHTIFVSSFSKNFTLTGERFGWVTFGDPAIATAIVASWTNSMASLPGEWQIRYMAYYRLLQERPWLNEKLRAFYRYRRKRLIAQLERIKAEQGLFAEVYIDDDATVYNWSRLQSEEDAFSLFEKTGIAGVPGSGFSYTDEYIRFSIGVIPIE
ncbi:pyridoxal phosphate-dependent aminotransferase [Ktedonosporobacter rubrisoli]|uniref:Pyridoxal phosphate-dependent aminotransferase n=1 Tax=Ktedonosporobacter rubrisoli TaxID=2509675 RepID=A0A4V0YZN6_KTERU|nr:pyridoxal phosphate-dependent aminotransferase [Ktedonosporobacter rubrisoli]QBD80351.1 pyridoxal phosphate-dependent aminotransferase [Ktedonosporobacter rubrisoli]